MRALLTLWWWRWVTSVHDRLHTERGVLWDTYRLERGYKTEMTSPTIQGSNITWTRVEYGSDRWLNNQD